MNVPLYVVTLFLQNGSTDFDEILYATQACPN